MAVVFTVLMVMAGIYALFKWPIPTLAVLGVLIVIGKSGENKNGGTAPTTAPPPAKPKAPSSPIKPQAVQPTVQAQPKAPEVRKAYFGQADTITGVRVYDINGALAGQQSISLKRTSLNVALLRFTFPLIETEE